jgi:hypothetical protein
MTEAEKEESAVYCVTVLYIYLDIGVKCLLAAVNTVN